MALTFSSVVAFLCMCLAVLAHEPLTDGPSKAPAYSAWQKALTIPSNKVSLAARRVDVDCKRPYFWLKYTGQKGDVLSVEAGTYAATGLNLVRASAVIFGPGLPAPKKKFSFPTPAGGARVVVGATDVSTCKFLPKEKFDGQLVYKIGGAKRCGTVVPNVASSFFPLLSYKFVLPATGTYYFVYFTKGQYVSRWYIGTGSWKHVHANITLPTPPKGNAGISNDAFWDYKVKAACCVKGRTVSKCPSKKIFA